MLPSYLYVEARELSSWKYEAQCLLEPGKDWGTSEEEVCSWVEETTSPIL